MSLAPIVLFVYNRPWHTQKTVESLKNNFLAEDSELFIFSDGPKTESDVTKVDEVRSYVQKIEGFKKVEIEESEINKGLAGSVIEGVSKVLNKYDKAIIIEDDLILSSNFLQFINDGLEFYKMYPNIYSITGFCPPIKIPFDYNKDVYFSRRASSWGWGTFKKNWDKVNWENNFIRDFLNNESLQNNFNKWGPDLSPMLKSQYYGVIDSWAIRWSYSHFIHNAYCVYPVKSFIQNIGTDHSGTHFKSTTKYNVILNDQYSNFHFEENVEPNYEILRRINKLVKPSPIRKVINYLKFKFYSYFRRI